MLSSENRLCYAAGAFEPTIGVLAKLLKMTRLIISLPLSFAVLVAPALAAADEPAHSVDHNGPASEPEIWNGSSAATCAWPTTVAVQGVSGLCTGTLVHPKLVVYAAHCGSNTQALVFGESTSSAAKIAPEFCRTNPDYGGASDQGDDWAFCVLAEEAPMPVTPTVYGCETDILFTGQEIAIAGFGASTSSNTGSGTKRWALTRLDGISFNSNVAITNGGGDASVCSGDSGGPMFVRYPDDSWHAFGIASTVSGGCGGTGTHSLIPGAAAWIESTSGYDITPCHDIEGNWAPGPLCRGFNAQDPGYGGDTWANWCSNVASIGWASTCGPSLPELDNEPPTVAITNPPNGTVYDEAPAVFDLQVNAQDDLDYIKVEIEVNGAIQPLSDDTPPYQFSGVNFPAGAWTIRAIATDAADNVVYSAPVGFGVGQEAPQTSGDDDGGDDGGGDGGGDDGDNSGGTGGIGGTGGEGGGEADGDGGCACDASPSGRGATGFAALLLGGLLLRRRRR